MNAFQNAVEVVLPVVLVLVIGYLFARWRDFTLEHAKGLGRLCFWVCLPVFILRDVARADPGALFNAPLCAGLVVVLTVTGIAAYRYARWLGAPMERVGVIAQAAFRSNMMYVGLPVLLYFVESRIDSHAGPAAVAEALENARGLSAVTLCAALPVLNVGSIIYFLLPKRHREGEHVSAGRILFALFSNPLFVAVLIGFAIAAIPGAVEWIAPRTVLGRMLDMVSAAALPLALFSVGAMVDPERALKGWRESLPVASIKLLLMPAAGLGLLWALGVRGVALAVGVVMLACPTAASSHAMAVEMGGDEVFAGELVAVTTLLCPVTLVIWLSVLTVLGA